MFKNTVAAFTALSLVACSSMHVVERPPPSSVKQQLTVGRTAHIGTYSGNTYQLKITALGDDALTGRDADDRPVQLRYAEVQRIEQKEFSGAKTAGLAVGVTALLWVAGILAFAYAFEHAFDDDK